MGSRRELLSAMRPPTPDEMGHPAVRRKAWAGEMGQDTGTGEGATPITTRAQNHLLRERVMAGEMAYDQGGDPGQRGPTPITDRANAYLEQERQEAVDQLVHPAARTARQQKADEAYQYGQQYLNNPFDAKGRGRIGRQLLDYPFGGHVRRGLEGQQLFGHTITGDEALLAERTLAGLTATGIGVPAFLEAVRGLSTPQTQGTIPMS